MHSLLQLPKHLCHLDDIPGYCAIRLLLWLGYRKGNSSKIHRIRRSSGIFPSIQKIIFNKEDLHVEKAKKGYFEEMMTLEVDNPQDEEMSESSEDENGTASDDSHIKAPLMEKISE